MQFTRIFAATAVVAASVAMASPAAQPPVVADAGLQRRSSSSKSSCGDGLLGELDKTLESILPELKPLLEAVDATETELGKAIPLVGDLLDLLKAICIG
ncbi:uncharacterized protein MJAP1_003590 [Malassezia japonica]|uniref:Uncharacterized protein n=1 Tax=Malassezia japonica TaxID=223818 RepID=A0AAF0JB69_9BASI|nr:uncharacterized protein MJAP1_003590 [Malassezia japonica]WFD40602.1 hypothetical protein MJAP1_003590 [Malassezia japonica]